MPWYLIFIGIVVVILIILLFVGLKKHFYNDPSDVRMRDSKSEESVFDNFYKLFSDYQITPTDEKKDVLILLCKTQIELYQKRAIQGYEFVYSGATLYPIIQKWLETGSLEIADIQEICDLYSHEKEHDIKNINFSREDYCRRARWELCWIMAEGCRELNIGTDEFHYLLLGLHDYILSLKNDKNVYQRYIDRINLMVPGIISFFEKGEGDKKNLINFYCLLRANSERLQISEEKSKEYLENIKKLLPGLVATDEWLMDHCLQLVRLRALA